MLDEVKEGVLYMKTHELEKELGISKHTIFYYEKEG
ncbi:MerR family transcriptional regulator, partial [Coprobacillus sp. OF03-2AA]